MYRSRSRSCTSLLLVALAACSDGGGDDEGVVCGTGGAPADGITLTGEGIEVRYQGFLAGPNNDCPDTDPSAPTSMTIVGTQADSGAALVLCVSRPDRFGNQATPLGTAIIVEDADGVAGGCTLNASKDTAAPTGTARAEGYCDDGKNAAGFALVIDAEVNVAVRCGDAEQTRRLRISGRAAVSI
jgi:hypothetical protein